MSKMQENSKDEKDILVTGDDETRVEYNALGVEEIRELLNKGQYTKLRQLMQELNDADVADYLEEMDESEVIKIFRILPKDMAADVFACLEIDQQQSVITSLSDKDAARILDNMMSDDAKELMEEMPANVVKRLIANTSPDTRHAINHLMRYPEDSAGSIMTVEYVDLKEHQTVAEAIERIRKVGVDSETINICYVLDNKRTLVGTVALRYLLLSEPDAVIGDIMHKNVVSLHTLMDQEEVARQFKKYDFTAMPVVDNEDRLVGIITVDDVVDILEEETTEDIEKMAALTPSDKPYLKTSIFETFKKRIPWLLLLMISATFTGGIITSFEDALSRYVVLTAYIPMLMDTGGNAGGQASATIIRGLSLDEVTFKDWPIVMWREIRTAVLCGAALSLCNFAKLMVFDRVGVSVAFVVCVTLLLAVIVAKIVGSMLPILAKKIGMDPAVMASPFITTIVDAISLLIYFRVATIVLGI
jgi:magnesium transporter